jgi:putative tryptophan/tyrosine transport system substrate-binding protein
MKRRELIVGVGSSIAAAAGWPLRARAQQAAMPVIGFLHSGSPEPNAERVAGFSRGLRESGFVEGQNVAIEYRWAGGQFSRLPELAADLIQRRVAVITTLADTTAALAAKAATQTIPIVFAIGGDPVAMGLVPSLNRPAGNITGVSILQVELTRKRLGLLRDAVPNTNRFCALVNPKNAVGNSVRKEVDTGAAALGLNIEVFEVSTEADMESSLAAIAAKPNSAFVSGTDAFLFARRARFAELALQHKIPAVYDARDYVRSGGLMSYGADIVRIFGSAGSYVAQSSRVRSRPICRSSNRTSSRPLSI